MLNVTVTSAYIPLEVRHLSRQQYEEYGARLKEACGDRACFYDKGFELSDCWLSGHPGILDMKPATATPSDRYATPADHVKSHIIQHSRTQWALRALLERPQSDVIVWLDYAILKQGGWRNNPVTEDHVRAFLDKVAAGKWSGIPFPGITAPEPVKPQGNNWRFCGSTHIWPVQYLPAIHKTYRAKLLEFLRVYDCVPLDLAIWPMVERDSGLPFRFYQAQYDASQLTDFPDA